MIGILIDKRIPPDDCQCWPSVACGIRFTPMRLAEFPQSVRVVPPLASWRPKNVSLSKLNLGWPAPLPSPVIWLSGSHWRSRFPPLASADPKKGLYLILHFCALLLVFFIRRYDGFSNCAIPPCSAFISPIFSLSTAVTCAVDCDL